MSVSLVTLKQMVRYTIRRIFLLTALYTIIIFGIIALQFKNANGFSLSLGSLRVSGSYDVADSGSKVPALPLHIGVNGLDFFLDLQHPLKVFASNNRESSVVLEEIIPSDRSILLRFSEGVSVSFASEKRGDADITTISATLPKKYQKIHFPYKITRSTRLEKNESQVLVVAGDAKYTFSGSAIDIKPGVTERSLELAASSPVVHYQTWIPVKGLNLNDLGLIAGARPEAYRASIEKFAAAALASFKDTLASGTISEPVVAAYIAEMGRVGMYHAALDSVPESWRTGPSRTWLTNTFLNNLEKTWAGFMVRERDERTRLSRQISEQSPQCFEFPSLVQYLVDRGSTVLLSDLSRFASTLDMTSVTALQAAGILEASLDFSFYVPDRDNLLESLTESCERKLTASLVRIADSLYISEDGVSVDTAKTLRIATVLIRYGSSASSRSSWRAAGQLLVTSLLGFSGDRAALPSAFLFSGESGPAERTGPTERSGVVAQAESVLSPAVLYPIILTGSPWYPHAESLALQGFPGMWAWTSAQAVAIRETAKGVVKLTVKFPQGETHYMVIRGVKPFSRIQIYGMDFRTDPRFESYNSSGYRYSAETETLYLKMRHKAEFEDVILYYEEAKRAPVAPPAEEKAAPTAQSSGGPAEDAAPGAPAVTPAVTQPAP